MARKDLPVVTREIHFLPQQKGGGPLWRGTTVGGPSERTQQSNLGASSRVAFPSTGAAGNMNSTSKSSVSSSTKKPSDRSIRHLSKGKHITEELFYKSVGAWLANETQQLYYQFTAHKDGSQGETIIMRSFHWRPPDDPIPPGAPTNDTTRGAGTMECTQVNGLEEMHRSTSIGR